MPQLNVYIPSGHTNEEKRQLLYRCKMVLRDASKNPKFFDSTTCIREYRPESVYNGKYSIVLYTTVGKPLSMKAEIAAGFNRACREVFKDNNLETYISFQEHTRGNVCRLGRLASRQEL